MTGGVIYHIALAEANGMPHTGLSDPARTGRRGGPGPWPWASRAISPCFTPGKRPPGRLGQPYLFQGAAARVSLMRKHFLRADRAVFGDSNSFRLACAADVRY